MRSGKLDRTITIERLERTTGAAGTVTETWAPLFVAHAELISADTTEAIAAHGEANTMVLEFRIRTRPGITTADRVLYRGEPHNIRAIREIGRRELILRVERIAP